MPILTDLHVKTDLLQQSSRPTAWRDLAPAMDRLSQLLIPNDPCATVTAEGEF